MTEKQRDQKVQSNQDDEKNEDKSTRRDYYSSVEKSTDIKDSKSTEQQKENPDQQNQEQNNRITNGTTQGKSTQNQPNQNRSSQNQENTSNTPPPTNKGNQVEDEGSVEGHDHDELSHAKKTDYPTANNDDTAGDDENDAENPEGETNYPN